MKYFKGTIDFPSVFWFISSQIGHARNVMNADNNTKNKRYLRGDKEKHIDTIGVLGELIAVHWLTENKKEFQSCKLLDYTSVKAADIVYNKTRIDVKTNKHSKYTHLLVNKEAHLKGKGKIDFYWFIYLLNDTNAEHFLVPYSVVTGWESKIMKYTEAFYIKRDQLK